ncbi:heme ABC transporter ATP-binding protein [Brevibacillus ruminantium]|uniref:Heme ABC transporter ATP-binding protein n=1 Tax=Brevibacillus ruminantium TaxID=2950604 RepID=A0ABY4WEZ2_9BACL|nr:heme ABC transporter ATP-binding protein [Brevibacillus ruminantium]USG63889.1 heme ABC transporter ATP-binding protein [Brevibacillus ruminantium]
MNLQARQVSVALSGKKILEHIDVQVSQGMFVGLIGPNGSGKSTLLKSMYRIKKPDDGIVSLNGEDVYQLSARQAAQRMAVVRQESTVEFDFTVREIVMMGRTAHKRLFQTDTAEDTRLVHEALVRTGMEEYAERSFQSLSGGEKQRVMIARALVQEAKLLILDEPTNHLDIRYQLQIMDLLRNLRLTVLAALHDLNIAAMYCDHLYVINEGRIAANGTPEEVLTPNLIHEVFGVETEIYVHPKTQKKHIVFFSGMHTSRWEKEEVSTAL